MSGITAEKAGKISAHLYLNDLMFEDRRFEADQCGPTGGGALVLLIFRMKRNNSPVIPIAEARTVLRHGDADTIIASLARYGFLEMLDNGDIAVVDHPDLWRIR